MLGHNPELSKIYEFALPLSSGARVYLLPLAYLLLVFVAWRIRRMSFELVIALLGTGFFLVLLLTPAAPGWFVWVLPFLVIYQVQHGRRSVLMVTRSACKRTRYRCCKPRCSRWASR